MPPGRPPSPTEAAALVLRQNRAYRAIIGAGRWLLVGWIPIAFLLRHAFGDASWTWAVVVLSIFGYLLVLAALSTIFTGLLADGRALLAVYRHDEAQGSPRWRFFRHVFADCTDPHFFKTPRFF
ncbi:MAG TPA: hypothetical protein VGF17_16775 [Phytomonospora sp.]